MTSGLVTKIGRIVKDSKISRREFLKVAGAATAVGAVGCSDRPTTDGDHTKYGQNIYPNVHGSHNQIPGVAEWYRSTCTECDAGCGIEVRTREGRAVKIEGSRDNPINRGGLCAIGQSALQNLYDPDRVRQPLQRSSEGGKTVWKPIEWAKAYDKVASALASPSGKKAFITRENSGSLAELLDGWCDAYKVDRVVYDPMSPVAEAQASQVAYGVYGIPKYYFNKAKVIVNFGADFLESWVSPCEYARDWASSRKSEEPVRVFHVEPRLSLTGANADSWISCSPKAVLDVALAVLKVLVDSGKGQGTDAFSAAKSLVTGVTISEVAEKSGVSTAQILVMADALSHAKASLVISGGTAAQASNGQTLHVVTALTNVLLGNVGKTIDLSKVRKPSSDASKVEALVSSLQKGDYSLLMVDCSNPAFTLPSGVGFGYGAKATKLVVSFSNKLDETAQFADLILPSSTSLESWGDARPFAGVYSLIQPTMTPVFDTKSLGDMLIDLANGMNQQNAVGGSKNFKEFLQASWKRIHSASGSSSSFEKFWEESLSKGGYFKEISGYGSARVDAKASNIKVEEAVFTSKGVDDGALVVYPYVSTKTFDGRAANRPWLQELPDPLTQVIWDSWAELHPTTAQKFGVKQGDVVTIRNDSGEISVPVYVTEFVHPQVVAVPLGQGHESFGRYAEQVSQANVWKLLPSARSEGAQEFSMLTATANVLRSRLKTDLVHMDGSKSQHGREIARTKLISSPSDLHGESHGGHEGSQAGSHSGHTESEPSMYQQREHPTYHWGMAIDLAACTGCSACVVACYAENNIAVVGKELARQGREMSWLRIDRYYEGGENEELTVHFMPMMCQHCNNAPCEPVCPVYATYHNEEGLNVMVYNRCVGTRYCANNCSYKIRHFNWFEYETPEPLNWQFNPDVVVRSVGVMEKCTFCSQRIAGAKDAAKDQGRMVQDGEVNPACVQSCPTEALVFGDLNDPNSRVRKLAESKRGYKVLDHHLNTQPSITYLEDIKYKNV